MYYRQAEESAMGLDSNNRVSGESGAIYCAAPRILSSVTVYSLRAE